MKKVIYTVDDKVVGYGEESQTVEVVKTPSFNGTAVMGIKSFVGGRGESVEVSDDLMGRLKDPKDKLKISDLSIGKGGKVIERKAPPEAPSK